MTVHRPEQERTLLGVSRKNAVLESRSPGNLFKIQLATRGQDVVSPRFQILFIEVELERLRLDGNICIQAAKHATTKGESERQMDDDCSPHGCSPLLLVHLVETSIMSILTSP